jgi:hypothetical protein
MTVKERPISFTVVDSAGFTSVPQVEKARPHPKGRGSQTGRDAGASYVPSGGLSPTAVLGSARSPEISAALLFRNHFGRRLRYQPNIVSELGQQSGAQA